MTVTMTRKTTPADLLDLLITKAPDLRAAGVRTVAIGTFSFALTPHEPPATTAPPPDVEHETNDPLFDPATYASRMIPGRARPGAPDEDLES